MKDFLIVIRLIVTLSMFICIIVVYHINIIMITQISFIMKHNQAKV